LKLSRTSEEDPPAFVAIKISFGDKPELNSTSFVITLCCGRVQCRGAAKTIALHQQHSVQSHAQVNSLNIITDCLFDITELVKIYCVHLLINSDKKLINLHLSPHFLTAYLVRTSLWCIALLCRNRWR